jgi:NADH-quinone oxidoreductase subunit A
MPALVASVLIFVAVGVVFLGANLVLGRLVRPRKPTPEKGGVYECGEEPIGSAWIQFDLRFYVVALLFVIFDVEIAFFFPWAVVFGTAARAGNERLPMADREAAAAALGSAPDPAAMHTLGVLAFLDLLVFFGVLLVGFAYLWKRGDLEWVRSVAAQVKDNAPQSPPVATGGLAETR